MVENNIKNRLIIGLTDSDGKVITPFSFLTINYDNENEYIYTFSASSGDIIEKLESTDGSYIDICDMRCKSYNELLIQMDLHCLWHTTPLDDEEICQTRAITNVKEKSRLKQKIKELLEENRRLKLKLNQLKILLDK